MLRIEAGDIEAIRVSDIFERSLNRLIEVTARLERDARLSRATDLVLGEQRVDLSAIAADIADQLDKVAIEHGVQVRVEENLPVLRMDHTHAELVFLNLLANGIKHSDSAKPKRFVEVINVRGRLMTGALIGAGVALLFAPRTGQEMRQQLGEQYRGLADRAGQTAQTIRENAQSLRDSAQNLKEQGRERVQRFADQLSDRVSSATESATADYRSSSDRFPSSAPSV